MNAPALTALAEFLSLMESVEGEGSAQMQTTHPAGCWGGRKSHGTHILLRVKAISLFMKDFYLIPHGFSTDCAVFGNSVTSQDIRWLVTLIADPPFVDRLYVCSVGKWFSQPEEGKMIKNSFVCNVYKYTRIDGWSQLPNQHYSPFTQDTCLSNRSPFHLSWSTVIANIFFTNKQKSVPKENDW